jgi:hypothetical protein
LHFIPGGDFTYRELSDDGAQLLFSIPPLNLVCVDSLDNAKKAIWEDKTYYKPKSKTFECIDSWMVINGEVWAFQFTVSKDHKISSALYWYFKHLNLRHYVTVAYDVDKFKKFKKKKITTSKKDPFIDEKEQPDDFNVKQYVLLVDCNSKVNFTDLWMIQRAEFKCFVRDQYSYETKMEYNAAGFEED